MGVTPADLWKILCLDDLVALVTQKHPYGEFIEFMKNSNFPEMVWSLSAKHWLFHDLLVVEVCWEEEFTTWDGASKVATGRHRGRLKMKHAATHFLPEIGRGLYALIYRGCVWLSSNDMFAANPTFACHGSRISFDMRKFLRRAI